MSSSHNQGGKNVPLWGESRQWWSLFYRGVDTQINSAQEMQARAELLRTHAFVMAGIPVPLRPVPAPQVITFKGIGLVDGMAQRERSLVRGME
jgi:hypothetical protein